MTQSNMARGFLAMNGAFSALTGITVLVASGRMSGLIFAEPAGWAPLVLIGLGIGLLIFAAGLLVMATDRFVSPAMVSLIVVADIGWVIGSAGFLVLYRDLFTSTGVGLVAGVAAVVAVFATGQAIGARRITPPHGRVQVTCRNGQISANVTRRVAAPVEAVWAIMTDHPAYADVASNLSRVEVVSGEGLGMERRCYGPKGESWGETCDLFEEGRVFGFAIDTAAPDYPYPFSALSGRWAVEPVGAGSEFSIAITGTLKGGVAIRTMIALMARRQFTPVLVDLADGWAAKMEQSTGVGSG